MILGTCYNNVLHPDPSTVSPVSPPAADKSRESGDNMTPSSDMWSWVQVMQWWEQCEKCRYDQVCCDNVADKTSDNHINNHLPLQHSTVGAEAQQKLEWKTHQNELWEIKSHCHWTQKNIEWFTVIYELNGAEGRQLFVRILRIYPKFSTYQSSVFYYLW